MQLGLQTKNVILLVESDIFRTPRACLDLQVGTRLYIVIAAK